MTGMAERTLAMLPSRTRTGRPGWPVGLAGVLGLAVVVDLSIGPFPVQPGEIVRFFLAWAGLDTMADERFRTLHTILIELRLPRVLTAILVGMALASSGAAFQAVFRNPLVSPGLLGVLGGAAFGGALAMVLDGSRLLVETLSFTMGLAAVAVGVTIGTMFASASMVTLVLGGLISSALFAALLSMIKYVADPLNQLPSIIYWLMGNLGQADLGRIGWSAVPILAGVAILTLCGRAIDALSMGDDEARAIGIPVTLLRYGLIAVATLISALTVSLAGMIGWVGLIVPHFARLLLGPGNARLIPASAILGAAFMVAADIVSRGVTSIEIPIGIVTELLGIPAFLIVLHRSRRGWV